ncbi:MAG: AhpC/TSA family protein [Muribaculaceae bacterium]|nr:AhpC/TSA family protein [Muribaculaceae bacterium]
MKSLPIFILTTACIFGAISCSKKSDQYTLNGNFDESENGASVLIISMSSGDTIARDTIRNGKFQIVGEVVTPDLVQVRVGGRSEGQIVLEPGEITLTSEYVAGTPLNDVINGWYQKYNATAAFLQENQNDSTKLEETMAKYDQLKAYGDSLMFANMDNPVGANFMINNAYDMNVEELEKALEEHPSLKNYSKITKILDQKKLAEETEIGKPYKDFEVTYEGRTTKLSDLMQSDHYTLVDFWASWCGPCRREIPVIKEIQKEWGPKGLDVVGVAVWDEPDNTKKAMEDLGIDWPVIIDAGTIPTDMYGILGIPCIILIGPDGTILSRGLQGDELKESVANAMSKS